MIGVAVRLARSRFQVDVSFSAGAGITALFGPSGAGKSTILNLIAGLERPDWGRIEIDGQVLFDSDKGISIPVHKRRIGYVFQDELLFPHMSVKNNLLYGAVKEGPSLALVVDLLDIGHLVQARPGTLSGGERQRVAIGRALLSSPRLLLMDEPFASLDVVRKSQILPYIERLNTTFGLPVIYVSHALGEVARLASHVVVLQHGRVVGEGLPQTVLPLAAASTDRFDRVSLLNATVKAHNIIYGMTSLSHPAGDLSLMGQVGSIGERATLVIRATDVTLAKDYPVNLSARTIIKGMIVSLEESEHPTAYVNIGLSSGERLVAAVTRMAIHDLELKPDQPIWCLIKAVSIDERWLAAH